MHNTPITQTKEIMWAFHFKLINVVQNKNINKTRSGLTVSKILLRLFLDDILKMSISFGQILLSHKLFRDLYSQRKLDSENQNKYLF